MARESNANFAATNARFRFFARAAGVEPTRRQASKYRRGFGRADWARRAMSTLQGMSAENQTAERLSLRLRVSEERAALLLKVWKEAR